MSKILVCGGAGYIGGLTSDHLIKAGHSVTVYDNLLYENRYLKDISFVYGDICDTEKLLNMAEDNDIIILMAALVGDAACAINVPMTYEINYLAVKRFCEQVSPDKHIIFMSTCSVYGAQDGVLNEESETNPLSHYATTKLMAEQSVLDAGGTIFRLGTVYGLGDTYSRLRFDLVVNVLTMHAVHNGEITIFGGEQWRPIISVTDIAGYIQEACDKRYSGIYIISKENVTMRNLGNYIKDIIPDVKINYTDILFEDARNYKVDNSKALNTFSYQPEVTVEREVRRIVNILKECRVRNPEDIVYHNGGYLKDIL